MLLTQHTFTVSIEQSLALKTYISKTSMELQVFILSKILSAFSQKFLNFTFTPCVNQNALIPTANMDAPLLVFEATLVLTLGIANDLLYTTKNGSRHSKAHTRTATSANAKST
jgi:hypothetical protein